MKTARAASALPGCSMQGFEDTTVIDVPKGIGNRLPPLPRCWDWQRRRLL